MNWTAEATGAMSPRDNLRQSIARALRAECFADILRLTSPSPCTRFAYARLQDILRVLRSGDRCTAVSLARAARTSPKTIHRDLNFMRRQGLKIQFDRGEHTYQLDRTQNHPWFMGEKLEAA